MAFLLYCAKTCVILVALPFSILGAERLCFVNSISSDCGSLRLLRALGGTRILQAAAPTTPPCFRRWRRSSPLHSAGDSRPPVQVA